VILNATNNKPERTMKTKFYLAGGVCAASLALCMPLNAQFSPATTASPATSPQAMASPAAKPAMRALPFRGKISAVDQSAKTFTVGGKEGSRVFKVTETTTITKTGTAATMTDIVENEQARGTYLKQADGTLEAKTVKLGPKTEGEKKVRKSKKGAAAEGSPAASPTP
jgi:carbohydrate-binding DOMON domain-containing protein